MRPRAHPIAVILLGLIVITAQGCMVVAGAAMGAGGYAYVTGAVEQNVDAHYAELHGATLDALRSDIRATVISEDLGTEGSDIHAEAADGRAIKIKIEALTLRASHIRIRVGIIGDEPESLRILNATLKRI
ncbi:MAG: DUF3568 domain-containing protein [Candidatus Omnitrophica bacterium]|nr:DUF3568 domain-containing protein [Candidatus Omnitrophota bacterium]